MQFYSPFLVVIAFMLCPFLFESEAPATHTVTLRVNTSTVQASNIDASCNFGQEAGVSNREFITVVRRGDIVVWNGVSSSNPETDVVLIESIYRDEGERIFTKDTLASTGQNPGVVLGTIASGEDGDIIKYSVAFKVMNNGRERGEIYRVDPKIMVKD